MKRFRTILTIGASLAAALGAFAIIQSPAFADSNRTIAAGVNSACDPTQREFVVAGGQVATNFSITRFSGGFGCGTGNMINDGGFEISRGNCPAQGGDVYWYRQTIGGSQSQPALSSLRLNPGTYCVSFNGGRNGSVELSYTITP